MRRIRVILIALLCLPLTACFEEPVREHVHVTIRADGTVVVTVVQEVAASERGADNPELAERLEELRETIEQDLDPWSQRFANLEPVAEHRSIDTVEGELRRSIRSAVFESFNDVVPLLEADGLTGSLAAAGRVAELNLFPTGGSRATYFQRQAAEHLLREWSAHLADYFAAAVDLYVYFDRRPERAVPCLAHIFDKHEGIDGTGPLNPAEEELTARVKETMEEVAMALVVDDDEAFSLIELSRLVYDPFPARLTIAVELNVVESVGFDAGNGSFERPAVDVWNALRKLEGRFIAPDLVTAAAAPLPEDRQPDPDVLLFASQPRRYSMPPTSGDVESALLAELVPEELLMLRWRIPERSGRELDLPSDDWIDVMAAAEAGIPD